MRSQNFTITNIDGFTVFSNIFLLVFRSLGFFSWTAHFNTVRVDDLQNYISSSYLCMVPSSSINQCCTVDAGTKTGGVGVHQLDEISSLAVPCLVLSRPSLVCTSSVNVCIHTTILLVYLCSCIYIYV